MINHKLSNEIMGEERAYSYFLTAFVHILNNKYSAFEIAISADVSEAYISQIKNEKRHAGFKGQVKIANACGYDYLGFLQLGRELIEGPAEKAAPGPEHEKIEKADPVISMHQDLIKGFKDPETAKEVNSILIKIEATDPNEYYKLVGRIEAKGEELASKSKNGRDDPGKHRTA